MRDFDRVQNLKGAIPQTFNDIPEHDSFYEEEMVMNVHRRQSMEMEPVTPSRSAARKKASDVMSPYKYAGLNYFDGINAIREEREAEYSEEKKAQENYDQLRAKVI